MFWMDDVSLWTIDNMRLTLLLSAVIQLVEDGSVYTVYYSSSLITMLMLGHKEERALSELNLPDRSLSV
jgi:hypothetical protein